jgi:hypothetical protein
LLIPSLSNEHLFKLIDFITKEPVSNEHKIGYKFPFTACEILASDNSQILDKIFEERFVDEDKSNILEDNDTEKINKNERSDSLNELSSEETKQHVDESNQTPEETHVSTNISPNVEQVHHEETNNNLKEKSSEETPQQDQQDEGKKALKIKKPMKIQIYIIKNQMSIEIMKISTLIMKSKRIILTMFQRI